MQWYEVLLAKWPDFVVTVLGVLVGVPPALWIGWKLAQWQMAREREAEERRDLGFLLAHLDRVKVEIRDNQQTAAHLIPLLDQAGPANQLAKADLFRWAGKRAEALSVAAYEDVASSGLHRKLPINIQRELFAARQDAVSLKYMMSTGQPAVEFYIRFGKSQELDELIQNARTYARTVHDSLDHSKTAAYEYADQLRQRLGG